MDNPNSKKKILNPINLFILIGMSSLFILISFFQIRALITKSYRITTTDLYRLDSIKMLSRAFTISSGMDKPRSYEFEDEHYKTFSISGSSFTAITNDLSSELYDTLQYSELVVTIYTDKYGFKNYLNKENIDKIKVFGIKVGSRSYIDLKDINAEEKKGRISFLIFSAIAYIIFLIIHLYRVIRM